MSFEELYPIVKEQAYYAVLRYEEPERRKDKIQELVCQSYEKFTRDVARGKEIKKQDYKCFVTQRAKEVDKRSICKQGYGGNSISDVLSFYRRRTDAEIVAFDDWMTSKPRADKERIEDEIMFRIDFKDWTATLDDLQKKILDYLMQGFSAKNISEMMSVAYGKVVNLIRNLKIAFLNYFNEPVVALP
jgi:hypothetical protein